jgi:hypothetical protein
MRWIATHVADIIKFLVTIAIAVAGGWGALQSDLAYIRQKNALQDAAIIEIRNTQQRVIAESTMQNAELKSQLHEIQVQLRDMSNSIAVLADRANYPRSNRNDDED